MGLPPFDRFDLLSAQTISADMATTDAPWRFVDLCAYDLEGRGYSLEVGTTASFLAAAGDEADSPEAAVEQMPLGVFAGVAVTVTTDYDYPVTIADTDSFDESLLEALVYGPSKVRSAIFTPLLTEVEQQWFEEHDERALQDQLPVAEAALRSQFGNQWRIESGEAVRAAQVLIEAGYSSPPRRLLERHPLRFSNKAREIICAIHERHWPDT